MRNEHAGPRQAFSPTPRWWVAAGVVLLAAGAVVAYLPALHGAFLWDDDSYVSDNLTLRLSDGLYRIWFAPKASPQYYPVVFTTFWLEYRLWGLAPVGFHLTNVALHAVNAVLVWAVLRRMHVPGALLAAAVFALHPVHVDSVAWIAERKDVLVAVFCLLALLVWLRFLETGRARWPLYAVVLVLFCGAMLSKTAACTLPLVFLLVAWWQKPATWRRQIPWVAALLVVGVPLGLITTWRESLYGNPPLPISDVERLLIAGRAVWFYAWKLVWPANLMAIYPRWEIDSRSPWPYVFPLSALAVVVVLWRLRERIGKAPLAAALSFALLLVPALGFVDFGFMSLSYVADHFQYVASIAILALLAALASRTAERYTGQRRWVGAVLAGVILVLLGTQTWRRCALYSDAEALWRDNVRRNPEAWAAHGFLGKALADRGRFSDAVPQFAAALQLNPSYTDAHGFWGVALERQGKLAEAAAHYALALRGTQPRRQAAAHNNLGRILAEQGKLDEAIQHYAAAAQAQPDDAGVHNNWGAALDRQGKLVAAGEQYATALRINPLDANAHNNLATILARQGKLDEAIEHFAVAARLKPNDARVPLNLGLVLAQHGRLEDARQQFAQAVRLDPADADGHTQLATVLMKQGRANEALPHFREAVRLKPGDVDAQRNLQNALAQTPARR